MDINLIDQQSFALGFIAGTSIYVTVASFGYILFSGLKSLISLFRA